MMLKNSWRYGRLSRIIYILSVERDGRIASSAEHIGAYQVCMSILSKGTPSKEEAKPLRNVTHLSNGGKWWEKFLEYLRSETFLHFFDFPHYKATRALQRGEANE